jgi:hypothetical protein
MTTLPGPPTPTPPGPDLLPQPSPGPDNPDLPPQPVPDPELPAPDPDPQPPAPEPDRQPSCAEPGRCKATDLPSAGPLPAGRTGFGMVGALETRARSAAALAGGNLFRSLLRTTSTSPSVAHEAIRVAHASWSSCLAAHERRRGDGRRRTRRSAPGAGMAARWGRPRLRAPRRWSGASWSRRRPRHWS